MRDYTGEMMDAWTEQGPQAAYNLGVTLRREIEEESEKLKRHKDAIQALGVVLRDRPEVDTTFDPADADPSLDTIESSERPRLIVEAAIQVWAHQQQGWPTDNSDLVKAGEVLEALRTKGLDLGVQQPLAVIGTVLSNADNFRKVARNTFEYSGDVTADEPRADPVEDLPW